MAITASRNSTMWVSPPPHRRGCSARSIPPSSSCFQAWSGSRRSSSPSADAAVRVSARRAASAVSELIIAARPPFPTRSLQSVRTPRERQARQPYRGAMEWWREPLASLVAGHKVIVVGGPAVMWTEPVTLLRELGATAVLVVGTEGIGVGPPPQDAAVVVVER